MTRYINLWNMQPCDDSVRVYTEEPVVVATFDRCDLMIFKNQVVAKKPGIYIIYNENKRYVGQSTKSVWDRFLNHEANKDWWDKAIVFSRDDGTLDKTQLDRLEKWMWSKLGSLGFEQDNMKSPPDGYIAPAQNNNARRLYERVIEIVTVDAKNDIFTRRRRKTRSPKKIITEVKETIELEPQIEDKENTESALSGILLKVRIHSDNYGIIEGDNFTQAYSKYLLNVLSNRDDDLTFRLSKAQITIQTSRISENKKGQYTKIDDTYSFYSKYSKTAVITEKIKLIAKEVEDNVSVEPVYHKGLL